MKFLKTTDANLQKGITVIDKNGANCVKKQYDSITDMPKDEMIMYIADAFNGTPDVSDLWARNCIDGLSILHKNKNAHQR